MPFVCLADPLRWSQATDSGKVGEHELAHLPLLLRDGQSSIHNGQVKFINHCLIFIDDTLLELLKTFAGITAQAQVHPGFVVFELGTTREDTLQRDIQGDAEIECTRRLDGKLVEFAYPTLIHTTCHVSRERRIDVAVRQYDRSGFERRNDVMLSAIGKIS